MALLPANSLFTKYLNNMKSGMDTIRHIAKADKIVVDHCCNCNRFLNISAPRKKPIMVVEHTKARNQVNGWQVNMVAIRLTDAIV